MVKHAKPVSHTRILKDTLLWKDRMVPCTFPSHDDVENVDTIHDCCICLLCSCRRPSLLLASLKQLALLPVL